jgi:PhoH-like ATPase
MADKETDKKGKTFILDTNIYGKNADSLFQFASDGNKVLVTSVNFEELDRNKGKNGSFGKNARNSSANLFWLTEKAKEKNLIGGYKTKEGGEVRILNDPESAIDPKKILKGFYANIGENDLKLICLAKLYKEKNPGEDVLLVSMDRNVVTLARNNGVKSEFKKGEQIDPRELYSGHRILINPDFGSDLFNTEYDKVRFDVRKGKIKGLENLVMNEYVVIASDETEFRRIKNEGEKPDVRKIFRYDMKNDLLLPLKYRGAPIIGYRPMNYEQVLAFDMLLDDSIKCKSLVGVAGTGKTFLALLVAIKKVTDRRASLIGHEKSYLPSIKVTRRQSNVGGEKYGDEPGNLDEKNLSNYKGLESNYERISYGVMPRGSSEINTDANNFFEKNGHTHNLRKEIMENDASLIELLPLGKIRGVSLADGDILFVDEGQNMESFAMKTLVTRVSEGEIYITGDVTQTDNLNTLEYDGLTHLVTAIQNTRDPKFAGLCASLTLRFNERGLTSLWGTKYL